MTLAILSLGTALPPTVLPQEDALCIAQMVDQAAGVQTPRMPSLYAATGVHSRRTVLGETVIRDMREGTRCSGSPFLPPDGINFPGPTTAERMRLYADEAPLLACRAAGAALYSAQLRGKDVTHLITVSCTGFSAPGVDVAVIRKLGLPPTVERTHIGYMGCHGAFNGLRVANAFSTVQSDARVLLCAVELCTLHYHYKRDMQATISNALFGDGAAAVVGVPKEAAAADAWRVAATGSCLIPDSESAMTWTIGDHGFEMSLSKHVPRLIALHLRPWLESWLHKHGVAIGQVSSWAVHPGGPRILDAVEESLVLPRGATDVSRAVLAQYGNMSSPTILFILERLRAAGARRPCVALGFGPGLMAEALLLR